MNTLLEWIAKFFGHVDVSGLEAMAIKGIKALIVIFAAYAVSRLVQRIIVRSLRRDKDNDENAIFTYKKVVGITVMTLGFLIAVHVMGINLTTLFHTGGLLAIAAAFALKNVADNLVSGFLLRIERTVKPGDVLETQGQMMTIKEVGLRGTIAITKASKYILIPNSQLIQNWIANYTYEDSLCQIWAVVGVAYSSDLKKVREVLEKVCDSFDGKYQRQPEVLLLGFGESAVNYKASIWIKNPWQSGKIKSELNEQIWWALKEAEIEIAFPQLDVHCNNVVTNQNFLGSEITGDNKSDET
jgi:small-conductance mechanosensitive channel